MLSITPQCLVLSLPTCLIMPAACIAAKSRFIVSTLVPETSDKFFSFTLSLDPPTGIGSTNSTSSTFQFWLTPSGFFPSGYNGRKTRPDVFPISNHTQHNFILDIADTYVQQTFIFASFCIFISKIQRTCS